MFDGICPKDRNFGSMFDQEQMVGFQMSLPSGILSNRSWKFLGSCVVMSKREVISCLSLACVALISSRSPERASLGGFPAGKREILSLHGNRSVARWKNSFYCPSNIILRWLGTDADISVPPLLR